MRALLFAAALLVACGRDIQTKEAVRQGVIDHLTSRKNLTLDLRAMDLEVTSVLFRENEADATIAFRVRGSAGPPAMQMRYTLQRDGSRWSVKSKNEAGGSPHGEGGAPLPQPGLPPGHPPVPKQ